MIRTMLCSMLVLLMGNSWSDTIDNYQHISKSIPKMEIKADEQSQAWARSARHVLTITNESIAETLIALNSEAAKQGKPFFCLPQNQQLSAEHLGQLIQEYTQNLGQQSANNRPTVSRIAFEAVVKKYPCQSGNRNTFSSLMQTNADMQHADAER